MADYLARQDAQGNWVFWNQRNVDIQGRRVSSDRLLQLYQEGIWSEQELNDLGIRTVVVNPVPDGQRIIDGTRRIEDIGGQLTDIADYEDIPPPRVKDLNERFDDFLHDANMTENELRSVLGLPARVTPRGG